MSETLFDPDDMLKCAEWLVSNHILDEDELKRWMMLVGELATQGWTAHKFARHIAHELKIVTYSGLD